MITKIYKKFFTVSVMLLAGVMLSSCNDWLDIKPNNEQVTEDFWQSKEDVESVVASGYYYMRLCVPQYIKFGELRGGAMYSSNSTDQKLQDFNLNSSNSLVAYTNFYKAINMANSVIYYAPGVMDKDDTYYESVMNSHLCEAYFQRAYSYLVLLKNYRDIPLIVSPYVDDTESFDQPKSSDTTVVSQIKADIQAALNTGAAKGTYENDWETKGRATKWALYALMTDVCLWNEDYELAVKYADMILDATDAFRPAFMKNTADWYTIFYPGNSNEGIFELNWDYSTNSATNNFSTALFPQSTSATMKFTNTALEKMKSETREVIENGASAEGRVGRMLLATYVPSDGVATSWESSTSLYLWKYYGNDIVDISGGVRSHQDANFILYRVAEIMLMKAQAEVMLGNYKEAVEIINQIRQRAGLTDFSATDAASIAQLDELQLLEEILDQKEMEFMAEGKRWYDLLWFGRIGNNKYKQQFIQKVIDGNQTTNAQWIESVLNDVNAWYLPLPESDIQHNKLLEQNPYYATTK